MQHCPGGGGGGVNRIAVSVFLWKDDSVQKVLARTVGLQVSPALRIRPAHLCGVESLQITPDPGIADNVGNSYIPDPANEVATYHDGLVSTLYISQGIVEILLEFI